MLGCSSLLWRLCSRILSLEMFPDLEREICATVCLDLRGPIGSSSKKGKTSRAGMKVPGENAAFCRPSFVARCEGGRGWKTSTPSLLPAHKTRTPDLSDYHGDSRVARFNASRR